MLGEGKATVSSPTATIHLYQHGAGILAVTRCSAGGRPATASVMLHEAAPLTRPHPSVSPPLRSGAPDNSRGIAGCHANWKPIFWMPACAGMTRLRPILRHSRESGNPFVSAVCGLQTASKSLKACGGDVGPVSASLASLRAVYMRRVKGVGCLHGAELFDRSDKRCEVTGGSLWTTGCLPAPGLP
jgi:hypothetical protein